MQTTLQNKRRNFAIENNIIPLIGKTFSTKGILKVLKSIGIKPACWLVDCFDPKDKDNFFNLTGLLIDGGHNHDKNEMEFKIFEL